MYIICSVLIARLSRLCTLMLTIVSYRLTLAVAIPLTVTNLIMERKGGLFDRSWVAGLYSVHIMMFVCVFSSSN